MAKLALKEEEEEEPKPKQRVKKNATVKANHGSEKFFLFVDYLFLGIFFCFLAFILMKLVVF